MKVVSKLALGFGLVIGLLLLVAIVAALRMAELDAAFKVAGERRWPSVSELNQVKAETARLAIGMRDLLMHSAAGNERAVTSDREAILNARTSIVRSAKFLDARLVSPRSRELLTQLDTEQQRYTELFARFDALIEEGQQEQAKEFLDTRIKPARMATEATVDALLLYQTELFQASIEGASQGVAEARLQIATAAVFALLAALGASIWITRGLLRQLGGEPSYAAGIAARVAAGDLNVEVTVRRGDRSSLLAAMKTMVENLALMVGDIRATGASMVSTVEVVGETVQTQAATAAQLSSSVAEITSTMEEFATSSNEIARNAKDVVDVADQTLVNSRTGAEGVSTLMGRMSDIHGDNVNSIREILALGARSKEIGKIMEIIRTVADRTRLIAFNAALEASSAGEAGRRFSVVAVEIRRLADNVTDSAEEIAAKIGEIQDSISRLVVTSEKGASAVAAGIQSSEEAAGRLDQIVEAASETRDAARQISLATQQQKTASSQVVIALREIVLANNTSAESNDRIVGIGKDLESLSRTLFAATQKFKLHERAAAGTARSQAASDRP